MRSLFQRPTSLLEVSERALAGANVPYEIRDFLHDFQAQPTFGMLRDAPLELEGKIENGTLYDAFLQALAVYLAPQTHHDPPEWTQPAKALVKPWFASPGSAIRNYLLISSPAPFRARNLFVDEDSLKVV